MAASLAVEAHAAFLAVFAGLAAYAGTNIDNLMLLFALAGGRSCARPVFLTTAVVVAVAVVLALGLTAIETGALRWLGLFPLGLGIWGLAVLARTPVDDTPYHPPHVPLVVVLLSNSGDSLAVFTPLFVDTARPLWPLLIAGVFVGAVLLLVVLARLQANARLAAFMARQGAWIAPCIMIVVGLYILADTPSDTV